MGDALEGRGTGPVPVPLVGRDVELAAVDEAVERVAAGRFGVTMLVGDPGLGKSRLAAEVLARHEAPGVGLAARAHRFGAMTSFGLWIEALDSHLRTRSERDIKRLCGASLNDMAALFRHVAAVAPTLGTHIPDRLSILAGLAEVLGNLASDSTVVVVLDDIHLADASSWGALPYLAQHLYGHPLHVVATARPAELQRSAEAEEVVAGLAQDGVLERVALRPLDAAAVAELAREALRDGGRDTGVGTTVTQPLVSWLVERSQGHPLFVLGLLWALRAEGADLNAPKLERLPASLRERVRGELRGLAADEREILDLLAVEDRRVELADLVHTSGQDLGELGVVLERLTRARLVAEHELGANLYYEVAHPLVQQTIYEEMGGAVRRSRHRLVARSLVASGRLGSAASHFARAAEPGEPEAIEVLCEALAQADEQGLYQEALLILGALLDLLPPGDMRWLDVLDAMTGKAEWIVSHLVEGDAETAIAAMRRIEALVEDSDDLERRARVQFQLASFLGFGAGDLVSARQACLRAMELSERGGQPEEALLARHELAWLEGAAGDLRAQEREVRRVATEANDAALIVQARSCLGFALGGRGELVEAERELRESAALARADGNDYRWAWGRTQLAMVLAFAGRVEEATSTVEQALAGHAGAADAIAFEVLAYCHWLAGRLPQAITAIHRSQARRPISGSRRRAWGGALAARVAAERADLARADRYSAQAAAVYGKEDFFVWAFWRDWAAGILEWQRGDGDAALATLDRAARSLRDMDAVTYEGLVLVDVAEIAAVSGDSTTARAACSRLQAIAERAGGDLYPALASLAEAWAAISDGRPDVSVEAAAMAAEQLDDRGYHFHGAVAADALARGYAAAGGSQTVAALQRAAGALEACDARWRRDRVLARLASLGPRGRRTAGALLGVEALTEREREIAQLAAQGFTAEQIGRQLFIGKRTVETHLANAYPKLGVRSKRELVQRGDELAL